MQIQKSKMFVLQKLILQSHFTVSKISFVVLEVQSHIDFKFKLFLAILIICLLFNLEQSLTYFSDICTLLKDPKQ